VNLAALWAAARRWYESHSVRDQRIVAGVALAIVLSLVYVGIVDPLIAYRRGVADEIQEGQEQLERAARFLGARETLAAERGDLRRRFEQAKTHLIPADSGTLGAAALQERANAIAAEKGITVQSTQVMREEPAEPFRKVAVRLTLQGELRPFADFVAGLEYGPQELRIPFVEVSRRGAVAGAKGPRTLTSTVEVSGYIAPAAAATPKDAAGDAGEAPAAAEGGGAAGEGAPEGGPPPGGPAPEGGPAAEAKPATAPEGMPVPEVKPLPEVEPAPGGMPAPEAKPLPGAMPVPEAKPLPGAKPTPEATPLPDAKPTPGTEAPPAGGAPVPQSGPTAKGAPAPEAATRPSEPPSPAAPTPGAPGALPAPRPAEPGKAPAAPGEKN
jgi:type II secretory pathway component PulM